MHLLYTVLHRFPIFLWQTLNKVENNGGAVVYVGSSLTAHNPLFFVHNSRLKKLMQCFYWSTGKFKMIGMLLNVVHSQVQKS